MLGLDADVWLDEETLEESWEEEILKASKILKKTVKVEGADEFDPNKKKPQQVGFLR